jgi:hypothetical protein
MPYRLWCHLMRVADYENRTRQVIVFDSQSNFEEGKTLSFISRCYFFSSYFCCSYAAGPFIDEA